MIKTRIFLQSNGCCGPATLRSLIHYWYKIDFPERDLIEMTGTTPEDGCAPEALSRVTEAFGFRAYHLTRDANLKDLEECVLRRIIPMVCYYDPKYKEDHWAMNLGFTSKKIILGDTVTGRERKLDKWEFYGNWIENRGGTIYNETIIAVPR